MYRRTSAPSSVASNLKSYKVTGNHTAINASVHVGTTGKEAQVEVVFREHQRRLLNLIEERIKQKGGFIVCAVAWFTNKAILNALIRAKSSNVTVAIVVQKEDFLRPDGANSFQQELQELYSNLGEFDTSLSADIEFINILAFAKPFVCSDSLHWFDWSKTGEYDQSKTPAVRCVGNHNQEKNPSFPRMHNKFFVFGTFGDEDDEDGPYVQPETVWTGSYNCSIAAENSFENAVIISSSAIAGTFLSEFALLFLLSETLDWTATWMAPAVSYST